MDYAGYHTLRFDRRGRILTVAYEMASNETADHQKAATAFREKRTPRFTGR